jgi:Tol biopolymer transport system component
VPRWRSALPWAVATGAIGLAAYAFAAARPADAPAGAVTRSQVLMVEPSLFIDVSSDGTRAVYNTLSQSGIALALRAMDEFDAKVIPGSEDGGFAIISPDGQWLAYNALSATKIRKIPIAGGTPTTLCDGTLSNGATWGADGTIAFSSGKGLLRVSQEGGTPEALTTVDASKREASHTRPQFLPDGKHLLFTITSTDAAAGPQFAVLNLDDSSQRIIGKGGLNGKYVRSGHLTYVRDATLFAVPFDLASLSIVGGEVPVVERISTTGPPGTADYAVSDTGLLAYFASGNDSQGTTLAWADREGKTEALPGEARHLWGTGRLSPDGRMLANGIDGASGSWDLWVLDVDRGTPTRLTFEGNADYPVWYPDSARVIFAGLRNGKHALYEVPADGSGQPREVLATSAAPVPTAISADGGTLFYTDGEQRRIMTVSLSADGPREARRPCPKPRRRFRRTAAGWRTPPWRPARWRSTSSRRPAAAPRCAFRPTAVRRRGGHATARSFSTGASRRAWRSPPSRSRPGTRFDPARRPRSSRNWPVRLGTSRPIGTASSSS